MGHEVFSLQEAAEMTDPGAPQKLLRFGEFAFDLQAGLLFERGVNCRAAQLWMAPF